ncbi:MAG: Poxvirus G6 [Bacteroidetes bacterium]|nr:Poxvirus G6 [Bacteroidota bacterium]
MSFKKRNILILLLIVTVATAGIIYMNTLHEREERTELCWENVLRQLETVEDHQAYLHKQIEELQELVEISLVSRAQMLEVVNEINEDLDVPISSRNLEVLRSGTTFQIDIRESLLAKALQYECIIQATEEDLARAGIDALLRYKVTMFSISAALVLYDNYMFGIILFEQDERLRRLVNDPDMGFDIAKNELAVVTKSAISIDNINRIKSALEFYKKERSRFKEEEKDDDFHYLDLLISQSPSYIYVKDISMGKMIGEKFKFYQRLGKDELAEMRDNGLNNVSKVFGNSMGLVETRKGKLYGDEGVKEHLFTILQPLDILLEKTPFRLTDKMIPGHFGHVAIWVGDEEQIKELGLWNHPQVMKFHDQLRSVDPEHVKDGHLIVEALRQGVKLSTLEEFLNVDDLVILRPAFCINKEKEKVEEAMLLTFKQIGKAYDFNFDVNTTEKIVCSELAYVCFPTIDWRTEKTVGRHTISPDNVAEKAWNDTPLKLICFYHDGELQDADLQMERMKELMQ